MAETKNIDEIAGRLSKDIFKHFLWATHPKTDDNFECSTRNMLARAGSRRRHTRAMWSFTTVTRISGRRCTCIQI